MKQREDVIMDAQKLDSMVGLRITLDGDLWRITAIDQTSALVSRERDGGHQIRYIDAALCLSACLVDEVVELEDVKPFSVD